MLFLRSLRFHLTLAIIAVMACSLALVTFLNYCNFDKDLSHFVQSRFMVMAKDVKNTIEYGLNIGLDLKELRTAQEIIEETKAKETDISRMYVVSSAGDILYHSDPARIGGAVRNDWTTTPAPGNSENLSFAQGDNIITVVPLTNNFGIRVGDLVFEYPEEIIGAQKRNMLKYLTVRLALVFTAFSFITFLGVRLFSGSLLQTLNRLSERLRQLSPQRTEPDQVIIGNSPVEERLDEFCRMTSDLFEDLDQIESQRPPCQKQGKANLCTKA